jgi:fructose-1,6-bisphosphatase I/sedoheptulose-1,7-bisphosphatase
MLVLSVGRGVQGFTLDPALGDFLLTHRDIRIPEETDEFSINASKSRFWEPPVKRYVDELLAGTSGLRRKDFNMRWIAAMVADAHRLLLRGGVFLYPRDTKTPSSAGRLRLLYEANPIGFLVEQAGGRASTGHGPVLEVEPTALHQRIGLVFGSKSEVERVERYHAEPDAQRSGDPLFGERGLFRD